MSIVVGVFLISISDEGYMAFKQLQWTPKTNKSLYVKAEFQWKQIARILLLLKKKMQLFLNESWDRLKQVFSKFKHPKKKKMIISQRERKFAKLLGDCSWNKY